MTDGMGYFLAACVPVVASGIGYLIKTMSTFRKENRADHNVVMAAVLDLKKDVKKVGKKLETHIDWHDDEK
jgi:hypothetical protein